MSPLPRFEKLPEGRRRAILSAATREFAEHGFEGASFNRIIEAAGISKGAMYYYFADKDDLYRTVLAEATERWFAYMGQPTLATDAASFWSACEEVYRRSLRLTLEDPAMAALCLSITRARERLEGHPALLELNQRMLSWMETIIRHGQAIGAIRRDVPADLLIHMGLSLVDGGDRWLAGRWDSLRIEDIEDIARLLVGIARRVGEKEG